MRAKMREGGQLTTARETSFRSGSFNVAVRELLGQYMALEELYMNETCLMAVRINEVRGWQGGGQAGSATGLSRCLYSV